MRAEAKNIFCKFILGKMFLIVNIMMHVQSDEPFMHK